MLIYMIVPDASILNSQQPLVVVTGHQTHFLISVYETGASGMDRKGGITVHTENLSFYGPLNK